MSEAQNLQVFSNGQLMGCLSEQDDVWAFEYDDSWRQEADSFPLSPALPLSQKLHRDGSTQRTVQWYFDNLLPEEQLRSVISKEQGLHASNAFGLLQRLGAESAGSLVLLSSQVAQAQSAEMGDMPLAKDELSRRIQNLPRASMTANSPKRMLLAGAQHKMVVMFDANKHTLREPLAGSASSHILKPNGQSAQYPHSVINETFTMLLARDLRVNVPPVYRLYVPEPVYIVERFDREWSPSTKQWIRKHALDACQLMDQPAVFKYQNATLNTLVELVDRCQMKAAARLSVFRWVLFNTLVGNSDSHLKNISFLISNQGVQVAPFYDLLSTAVYHTRVYADDSAVWPGEPLAIPVVEASVFGDVTRDKLVRTGVALGLSLASSSREVSSMVQRLPEKADALIAKLERHPDATPQTHGAESHLLRSVRSIVIAQMLRQMI